MIQKFVVSRDDSLYHAWPDVAVTRSGTLVCVFSECTHHGDRSFTRIMYTLSKDRGRTWSEKMPLSIGLRKTRESDPHWNCARITTLPDGRLLAIADKVAGPNEGSGIDGVQSNWLWTSQDEGESWSGPVNIPVRGIVPDKILAVPLPVNKWRWLASAHTAIGGHWKQQLWHSDDEGRSWTGPFVVAEEPGLQLCEGSILPLPDGTLICFLRENSGRGMDVFRTISRDGGETWGELSALPLPGCHRPVAGILRSGNILITYRFLQGGMPGWGRGAQNFFAALMDQKSCLAPRREESWARILPVDYDRSPVADLGYSGWVQFDDGEIIIVSYIVDDAPKAQIRGYSMREEDFLITSHRTDTTR